MNNNLSTYQAEIDYRREQMRRGRAPLRMWRRARTTTPKSHAR